MEFQHQFLTLVRILQNRITSMENCEIEYFK
jgi:hypothetical protein